MKQFLKRWMPPILLNKLFYLRAYKSFFRYKDLVAKNAKLKDKHKGKRCFILGSGPSIKEEDLRPLKDEIVFALNNFYVHPDFEVIMSGGETKYYMTAPIHPPQTEKEWEEWFMDMEKHINKNTIMLFGLNSNKYNIKYILDKYSLFKDHKKYWYFTGIKVDESYSFYSKDIDMSSLVWSANTVSIYAILFAIYMGFDTIYLLGMDHNSICMQGKSDIRFYQKAIHQRNEIDRLLKGSSFILHELSAQHKIFTQYQIIKKHLNVNIVNLSKSSLLDIYSKDILSNIVTYK